MNISLSSQFYTAYCTVFSCLEPTLLVFAVLRVYKKGEGCGHHLMQHPSPFGV